MDLADARPLSPAVLRLQRDHPYLFCLYVCQGQDGPATYGQSAEGGHTTIRHTSALPSDSSRELKFCVFIAADLEM